MMKVITGFMFFILAGVYVNGQQEAKVIAEIAAGNERTIKNAPFSAEAVSESVQVLADGNRIVRSSSSKLYRNSEGRFRREHKGGSGGMFGTTYSYGQGISILDPVIGHRVTLDNELRTARVIELNGGENVAIAGRAYATKALTEAQRAELENKVRTVKPLTEAQRAEYATKAEEFRKQAVELRSLAPAAVGGTHTIVNGDGFVFATGSQGKYETRKEDLGTRDFEGVSAKGVRRITTIPEGAIGNERAIEIVYESWHSSELGLVVYSEHDDPRFGKQTYRVTNIVRSEPDPSLFSVPHGYKMLADPPSVYHLKTKPTPAQSSGGATSATSPKAATVVNVKSTKP